MTRKKELVKLVRLFVVTTLLVGAILDWQSSLFFRRLENAPRDFPSVPNNEYEYEYI